MPRYKNSCGCYNRQDARELGLAAAIVWNDILDRSEHFDVNPMWYDQKSASERLGIPERSMNRAVEKLVEAERITKKRGYRPGTTTQTTWITIIAEEDDSVGGFRNDDLAVSRSDDLAVSILKETEERDLLEETAEDDLGMRPEVLYTRVHSMFKGPHEMKKQKIEAIRRLKEEFLLSDDTILNGFREIADSPSFTSKDGSTVTWNLSMLLLRNDMEKTARFLVQRAEQSGNSSKEERWNPYADQ